MLIIWTCAPPYVLRPLAKVLLTAVVCPVQTVRRWFRTIPLYKRYFMHTNNLVWWQRTQQKRGRFRVSVGDAFEHCKDVLPWWQHGRSVGEQGRRTLG